MIKDYFLLAYRNIIKRGLRSWLTMIGIFIGIAAVVALIGLGEGLRGAITAQFGILGTDVLSIRASGIDFAGPPGTAVINPLKDDLVDKIENVQGVESAFNRFIDSAIVEFNEIRDTGFIGSVPTEEDRKPFEEMLNLEVEDGRLLRDGDSKRVVLGNNFKDEDNRFRKSVIVGDRILINKEIFEVVGILKRKGSFILDGAVFMNEDVLLDKVRTNDEEVNIIAVKVRDENEIERVKENIEKLMRKERDVDRGEEDFIVESPQAALKSLDSTLFAVQMFVVIIAIISLLVGGIGIMNTMAKSGKTTSTRIIRFCRRSGWSNHGTDIFVWFCSARKSDSWNQPDTGKSKSSSNYWSTRIFICNRNNFWITARIPGIKAQADRKHKKGNMKGIMLRQLQIILIYD